VSKDISASRTTSQERTGSKLIFKFDEVVKITQLEPSTLESWEKEFPFLNAGRTGNGQKFFRRKDLDIILRIKELSASKRLTLAGIRRHIEEEFGLIPPTPVHPDKLRKALYHVRDELRQIASSLEKRREKK
jgi:DNA-binding transcriptional MerR regulator